MNWNKALILTAAVAAMLGGLMAGSAAAQTTPAPTPPVAAPQAAPAPAAPAAAAPAAPAAAAPAAETPPAAAAAAPAAKPDATTAPPPDVAPFPEKNPPDTSISQTLQLDPRPVIMLSGQSTWDDGFKTLNTSFVKLNDNLARIGIQPTGNPMAVFTETDDAGFKFTAMVPIDKAPDGKPAVDPEVGFGQSPGGKVMKFQHRSAYDDIDSTYEAITAYLDEKGLEARNIFAEEYLNRTKSPDDPALEVDIYVFLK